MHEALLNLALALITVGAVAISTYLVPYIKGKIGAQTYVNIVNWVGRAVKAAELLFNAPASGEAKRDYVIDFIDKKFNAKKEVISKEDIRVLLEAACEELKKTSQPK